MHSRARTLALVSTVGLLAAGLGAVPALAASPPSAPGHSTSHKVEYPTVQAAAASRAARGAAGATVRGSGQLSYGGGVDGIGVTTGTPQVYFVFWGSQWGTPTTDTNGILSLSGDSKGMAPYLQRLFKGIGTESGTSTWSGVMTQFCEGVATGATSCPATASHVGVPYAGALAGVWYDGGSAAPGTATDHEIGVEAYAALQHFKGQSGFDLRNAQFVVVSPSGTHPGGFNTGFSGPQFCAWHDYNGDTTLNGGAITSPEGDFAFTNMPYVTDLGASCGANYVNAGTAGALDGVSIVEGHEYAETITDMNPAGGWVDSSGYENADKCAWVGTGGTGGAQNVTFATGSFAMQGTYSNDTSSCLIAHAIVTNQTSVTTVTIDPLPGDTWSTPRNTTVTGPQMTGTTTGTTKTLTWSASGAPAGVSITSAGVFQGKTNRKVKTYLVTVTAKDVYGSAASYHFTWKVT
jgi:hypothetical protein